MVNLLIKKRCSSCGNLVICKRKKSGLTLSPKSCAVCKSLGVKRAIEERLMIDRVHNKTIFRAGRSDINKSDELMDKIRKKNPQRALKCEKTL